MNHTSHKYRKRVSKNSKTGFIGVHFEKAKNKYRAYIQIKRKFICIGRFEDINDAIKARNEYIIKNDLLHSYALAKI